MSPDDPKTVYEPLLGKALAQYHSEVIHQVMPQCQLFLCGTIFMDLVNVQGNSASAIPEILATNGSALIPEHLGMIIDYAKKNKDKADKSWPTLLKSNSFFSNVTAYIQGIRQNGKALAAPSSEPLKSASL